LYLIAQNPHVQRKAQEEIDHVVGTGRLPDVNNRPDLPYIEAMYRELLRYEPPLGIGVPHSLVEDDIVDEYFLPKGLSDWVVQWNDLSSYIRNSGFCQHLGHDARRKRLPGSIYIQTREIFQRGRYIK
jgi:hypothetical protein